MLSGGEQQRVAVARALVNQPALLLADEPTGDLDEGTADAMHALLRDMHREFGLTAILATHNPRLAEQCDRVLRLEGGALRRGRWTAALRGRRASPVGQAVPVQSYAARRRLLHVRLEPIDRPLPRQFRRGLVVARSRVVVEAVLSARVEVSLDISRWPPSAPPRTPASWR